jgi:hypothetical protein
MTPLRAGFTVPLNSKVCETTMRECDETAFTFTGVFTVGASGIAALEGATDKNEIKNGSTSNPEIFRIGFHLISSHLRWESIADFALLLSLCV